MASMWNGGLGHQNLAVNSLMLHLSCAAGTHHRIAEPLQHCNLSTRIPYIMSMCPRG